MATVAGVKPHPIYLAGSWVDSPEILEIENPARPGELAGATYLATEAQYEQAVEAAVKAFEVTRHLPAFERGAILRNISAGIKARREELGRLIALEAGKPIRDSLVEVDRATLTFRLGAEEAERMVGETIPLDLMPASKGRIGITRRFPIGPIAAISPFNFPLNLAAHKVAPAIASGNPIVLKPPSKDPLVMLTVAEIIEEAGAPASSMISATVSMTSGSLDGGLRTIGLPEAIAGATLWAARLSGKLNGLIAAIGPIGNRRVIPIRPFEAGIRSSGIVSPVIRSASSAPSRNVRVARSTSTSASRIGLPASAAISAPSVARRAATPAEMSRRILPRS